MPLCPQCGQVNSTLVTAYHPDRATVEFSCERKIRRRARLRLSRASSRSSAAKAKVGWKVDWALRWHVLKVDYELYGKDLIDSARLSGQILKVLGGKPPIGFPFEMYPRRGRAQGLQIGRARRRGRSMARYAPIEVLKYFLLLNPRRARKLFLEAIPQYVDEYLDTLRAWSGRWPTRTRRNSRSIGPAEFDAAPLPTRAASAS